MNKNKFVAAVLLLGMTITMAACQSQEVSKVNKPVISKPESSTVNSGVSNDSEIISFVNSFPDKITQGYKVSITSKCKSENGWITYTTSSWKKDDMLCLKTEYECNINGKTDKSYTGFLYTPDITYMICDGKIMDGVTGGYIDDENIKSNILSYLPTIKYVGKSGEFEKIAAANENGEDAISYAKMADSQTVIALDDLENDSNTTIFAYVELSDEDTKLLNINNYEKVSASQMALLTSQFTKNLNSWTEKL